MKNQHLIDGLSISDKVELLQHLYADIAGHGTDGDTELAHVNRFEAQVLRNIGGSGTINQVTGLRQFGKGGGGSAPPPATQQVVQKTTPEYAPEQKEYIRDIFEQSKQLYEQRGAEGFQQFPGPQLAPFAPQEQAAFTGIEQLARGPGPAQDFSLARQAALGAAAPIGQADISRLMSPYQQNVTDIAQREAIRQYQMGPAQQLRTQAVAEGGLRGARRAIQEAEGERNLGQRLTDIQTMGLQSAYDRALAQAASERGRLAGLAQQLPAIGTGAYQQQLAQLGQLGGVGEAQRGMEQQAINLAQQQFQKELMFPEETLATYLRFISGAPQPVGSYQTSQTFSAPPSMLSQLAGLGVGGASLGKAFNLFSSGGSVGKQAGLSGIVRRNKGGQIVRLNGGSADPNYQKRLFTGKDIAYENLGGEGTSNYFKRLFTGKDSESENQEGWNVPIPTSQGILNASQKVFSYSPPGMALEAGKWLLGPSKYAGEMRDFLGIPDEVLNSQYWKDRRDRIEAGLSNDPDAYAKVLADQEAARIKREGMTPEEEREISGFTGEETPADIAKMAQAAQQRKAEEAKAMAAAVPKPKPTPPERPAAKPTTKPQTAKEEAKGLLDRLESEDYLAIAAAAFGGIGKPTTGSALGDIGQALSPAAAAASESLREGRKARRERAADIREEEKLRLLQAEAARAEKLTPLEIEKIQATIALLLAQAEETADPIARRAKVAAFINKAMDEGKTWEEALAVLGMSVPSIVSGSQSVSEQKPNTYRTK
jgi:hypothetical protein